MERFCEVYNLFKNLEWYQVFARLQSTSKNKFTINTTTFNTTAINTTANNTTAGFPVILALISLVGVELLHCLCRIPLDAETIHLPYIISSVMGLTANSLYYTGQGLGYLGQQRIPPRNRHMPEYAPHSETYRSGYEGADSAQKHQGSGPGARTGTAS
ncbi:hypothetical protein SARC_06136 [Sphaeroforma arctica JP610]|uniref:Uncharacterized protein n=1 Tax=Sphaeroforma arctica JP610 TaxID=667725 RepID=A0A0L0FYA8_9EUKA|nr:hypothetical protein SARC_06136 [Sphaeroforma arctica JP610]KNC81546.1 hypothetical protein SARC_06136 [Sphaeroforma arctica JP610]|eukprot:XP_014155448.1 hypothetical protein SARC_06136 [Sphaeroforma arctica JP610]